MLLHDAWPGYKNLGEEESLHLVLKQIPPKTTRTVQPLDVYFFRPWKVFVRYISDHILLMDINVSLPKRNSMIKLHSMTHYQFSTERFQPLIRYAWFKAGYTIEREDVNFQTPATFYFEVTPSDACLECIVGNGTQEQVFARCAHCENDLCFTHFFIPLNPSMYHKCM